MNFDYEEIFKISIRAMRINKSHPDQKRNIKWIIHFLFHYGLASLVFYLIMNNIIFLNIKNNDFDLTCKNGTLSVVFIYATFHYCIMLWKQDLIMNLITLVKQDYVRAKSLPIDEQEIMMDYAKKGHFVCKQWLAIPSFTLALFPIKSVLVMTYHWAIGEPKLLLMYDLVYPIGFIEENKEKNIFVYLGLYAMWMFYGLYCVCMYAAYIPLAPNFISHACGQLDIVVKNIDGLFKCDLIETEMRLKETVKQLQRIYSFVEQINVTFRVSYELTLKTTTIVLPVACYAQLEAMRKGEISLEFLMFIIGGVLISSTSCVYSDNLMEKGERVRLAIYFCGWETVYDRGIRSTIVIILTRALKPLAIQTLFRTLCLETLTDLFHQSYAIFNLMNAMWK